MTETANRPRNTEAEYLSAVSRAEDGLISADTLHSSKVTTDVGRAARLLAGSLGFPTRTVLRDGVNTELPLIIVQTLAAGDGLHRRLVIEPTGLVSICDQTLSEDLLDWNTKKPPHPKTVVRNDRNLLEAVKQAGEQLKLENLTPEDTGEGREIAEPRGAEHTG